MDGARRALLAMAELQFAAGAREVLPVHELARPTTRWADARAQIRDLPMEPLKTRIVSAHVMGGCAMSGQEALGVVRPDGVHWQINNLSVHDGSLFPTSIGANPQLSIYGIVNRMTQQLLRELADAGLPTIEVVGVVTERGAGRDVRDGLLITRHLDYSLPYRTLLTGRGLRIPYLGERLLDALAGLLVRLHLAGFYWGDCSLSNTLFRRDAGAFAGWPSWVRVWSIGSFRLVLVGSSLGGMFPLYQTLRPSCPDLIRASTGSHCFYSAPSRRKSNPWTPGSSPGVTE